MLQAVAVPPLSVDAYAPFIGEAAVAELRRFAAPLAGARVLHLNATSFGGGVAELLPTMTALMCDLGLEAEWRVIAGDDAFFDVTKAIHNGLQGMSVGLDAAQRATYAAAQERIAKAFEGTYDAWTKVAKGEVDLQSAVLKGQLKFKGSITKILMYRDKFMRIADVLKNVPKEF